MWKWQEDYLKYVEKELKIKITKDDNKLVGFIDHLNKYGFPTEDKLWCCNSYKRKALLNAAGADHSNTILLTGITKNSEGQQLYRTKGEFTDSGISYAAPFAVQMDKAITEEIKKVGVKLNPIYQLLDQCLCPGCPAYSSSDMVFLKNHDLDLWTRWILYVGQGQHHREFVESGGLNTQLLRMIGEGMVPTEFGKYREDALPLPDVKQPRRDSIRVGDNYGWDKEEDAKLPIEEKLDVAREPWFEYEEYSNSYKAIEKQCADIHERIEKIGLENHMKKVIEKAKKIVAEQEKEEEEDFS